MSSLIRITSRLVTGSLRRETTVINPIIYGTINANAMRICQRSSYSNLSKFMENLKSDLSKNKDLQENIEKFRQETQKLEESEALQKAREKFQRVEEETMKGSQQVIENVKDTIKESVNQAKQTEIGRKTLEIGEQITKQAKGAVEGLSKQGESLKHTAAFKTVTQATRTVGKELDEAELIGRGPYKAPDILMKRADRSVRVSKQVEPNNETLDVELHKDSKWSQSWKAFKEDNQYINRVFDLKMKFDESDNPVVRVTRTIVDKIGDKLSGMFQKNDLSQVLTEICTIDPSFDINQFLRECETIIIPTILESMCQGDMETLNDWCHEAVFNVLCAPQKQAQQLGYKIHNKILDLENIDLALGKMMEQGPVLVVTFQAQQVIYIKDSKGNIIEGDPDKIIQNSYVMAFCRDQSDLDPATAWRLIDVAMQQSQFSF